MGESRVLFILKRREDYNAKLHSNVNLSTGLYNSASFVYQMLVDSGVNSKLVVVVDNNCIDREVTQYKPTHVIIEALWCVPSKFAVLCKLHPKIKWIIRLHSDLPFLANEGIAMDWLADYARFPNVIIAANAPRMLRETKVYLCSVFDWDNRTTKEKIIYLPNFYPQTYKKKHFNPKKDVVDICCFGAVRPLKNHLIQAVAAVEYAESQNKRLRFHINAGRIEMKGEPVLNNLRGMFMQLADKGHELISHQWCPREDFLKICADMDIGMQVSFSETFNIVAADLISQGVPVVGSIEIPWANKWFCADPVESGDIFCVLKTTAMFPQLNVWANRRQLNNYTNKTRTTWLSYFR